MWANSPAGAGYGGLWGTAVDARLRRRLPHDLHAWVDDGLMTVFTLAVGLEIEPSWWLGELRDRRKALRPVVAAVGGMVVPAATYLAVVGLDGPAARGWAIPMATDIAFAVGVLALLGRRVRPALGCSYWRWPSPTTSGRSPSSPWDTRRASASRRWRSLRFAWRPSP